MARRNLLAEAQVTAAAEVAPQVAALRVALQQARQDRNSAIHAAAAASGGIAHAISASRGKVKAGYTDAQKLAAPAQSFGSAAYGSAAANEHAVAGTALASSLGNALKELSDRRIQAAAGRAYATQKALGEYASTAAGLQQKRSDLARQQGLLAGSTLSKLTESAAGRKNQRLMQQRSLTSQSELQSERLSSQASLQSERLASSEAVAGARLRSSEHNAALGRRQQKLGRQNQRYLQNQRLAATGTKGGGGPKPTAATTFKGRQAILAARDVYASHGWMPGQQGSTPMHEIAADAKKNKVDPRYLNAAADLSTKGYISPKGVRELEAIGVAVPKEWTGVTVRPHTRRRRGK